MPLRPGSSQGALRANIAELMRTGKYPPHQAAAIAYSNAREGKELVSSTGQALNGVQAWNEAAFGPLSMPGVKPGRMSGLIRPTGKAYISPAPVSWWKQLGRGLKAGVSVDRTEDGARYMFLITSNSYKDREDETILTKALKGYVDSHWKGDQFIPQPFLFWHDDKMPALGEIVWADMEGPFLIEVAREGDNSFAHKMFDFVEKNPNYDGGWGTSHGFDFPEEDKSAGGDYSKIIKFETSLLTKKAAANSLTLSSVMGKAGHMEYRDRVLADILKVPKGLSTIKNIRKGVEAMNRTLQERGLQHKSVGTQKGMDAGIQAPIAPDQQAAVAAPPIETKVGPDPASILNALQVLAQVIELFSDMEPPAEAVAEMPVDEPMAEEQMSDDEDTTESGDTGYEDVTKEQAGYAEVGGSPSAGAGGTPPLINNSITKRPGSFPPPVPHQVATGKGKSLAQQEGAILTAIKSLGENINTLVKNQQTLESRQNKTDEALIELVELINGGQVNKAFAPSNPASVDSRTAVTDPDQLMQVQKQLGEVDQFWGAVVGPKLNVPGTNGHGGSS